MRSNLPKAELFLGKSISRFPNHVMQKHVASGNNGHLFYAFDASTNSELAFKIVPVDNLPRNIDDQYAYWHWFRLMSDPHEQFCWTTRLGRVMLLRRGLSLS
jgi:hypothetical protein